MQINHSVTLNPDELIEMFQDYMRAKYVIGRYDKILKINSIIPEIDIHSSRLIAEIKYEISEAPKC